MRQPRRSIRRALAVTLLAGLIGALVSAGADAKSGGHGGTLAANEAAARADVKVLLARVTLPAGAVREANVAPPSRIVPTTAGALAESTWKIGDVTPSQVMSYLAAHPPRGGTAAGTGSTSGPSGSSLDATFSFPDITGVIDDRVVQVSAAELADGASQVTVESESVWVLPRSAASMIPAATSSITVAVSSAQGRVLSSHTVRGVSRVRSTVRFFNGLEAGQPFLIACPLEPTNDNALTITFLGSGSQRLAQASWREVAGGDSGACDPVNLTVGGTGAGVLYGGEDYVTSLDRLLGVTLPTG